MATTNPSYKPNEGKREEFRRYLEKTGVMDALTKVLVLLYEETNKPDDALLFIMNSLAKQTGNETIDELKIQIAELQERVAKLEADNMKFNETADAEEVPVQEEAGEAEQDEPPAVVAVE